MPRCYLVTGTVEEHTDARALRAMNVLPSGQSATANADGAAVLVSLLQYGKPQLRADAWHILHQLSQNSETREAVAAVPAVVDACIAAFDTAPAGSLRGSRDASPSRSP